MEGVPEMRTVTQTGLNVWPRFSECLHDIGLEGGRSSNKPQAIFQATSNAQDDIGPAGYPIDALVVLGPLFTLTAPELRPPQPSAYHGLEARRVSTPEANTRKSFTI